MREHTFDLASEDIEHLGEHGFFVREQFLTGDICRVLCRSIDRLARAGDLRAAGVGRAGGHRRDPSIRGDYITWLDETDGYPWDTVAERFEHLRVALNRMGYLGLSDCNIQIARYPGDGSGFDRHLDTHRHGADRRLTATVYLNPDWQPSDGGRLRIYPTDDDPVEVAPVAGRIVAFLSDEVEHEVLPTYTPRFALSSWYRGRAPNIVGTSTPRR